MPFVTTRDGTQLFCRRWGSGPPIVFVHGWAVDSSLWESAMTLAVQAGFEAICYDRRSHGRSDDPGRGYDYDTLADDLAEVMAALDVTGATMVGHSMGAGEIARYIARHGGARVARVVMAAPALPYSLQTPDNPEGRTTAAQADAWHDAWATGWVEWLGAAAPAAYGPDASPDRVQHTLRAMLRCPAWVAIELNKTVTSTDFRGELRSLATPTLVLHGDADQSCPLESTGARLPALMPDCRLKVYPGADHTFIGGSARRIMEDVLAFIGAATPRIRLFSAQ
ncbi:MAG TPA: alpha/beta hydrolase [Caulobacteraceae bacterium]|jgi:pimeloyl-ACP methyl ester carboxylesterase